jgi:predicted SAM-dependent methyltransferase
LSSVFVFALGGAYQTADLFQPADLKLNMEAIDLPDASVDLIIANHVLEHVDDAKASRELSRILRPNGVLLCMVPIVEGWATTYQNPDITTDEGRMLHFGQEDHVRFYGRDFRDRIAKGGFNLREEITAEREDVIRYGLVRGEKVFVFEKA